MFYFKCTREPNYDSHFIDGGYWFRCDEERSKMHRITICDFKEGTRVWYREKREWDLGTVVAVDVDELLIYVKWDSDDEQDGYSPSQLGIVNEDK